MFFIKGQKSKMQKESKLYNVYDLHTGCREIANAYVTFTPEGKLLVRSRNFNNLMFEICLSNVQLTREINVSWKNCPHPKSITLSPDGKYLFTCDVNNYRICKFCFETGHESIFSGFDGKPGFKNGAKEQSTFAFPLTLKFSPDGSCMIVCDLTNNCIRRICAISGEVSTVIHLSNDPKAIFNPTDVTFSPDATYILICDMYFIHKISLLSGEVSVFAGTGEKGCKNGPKEQATFYHPQSLKFSPCETYVLVCDSGNHCVRKIALETGIVSTFVGIPGKFGVRNGPKEQALLNCPENLAFSKDGKIVIICDHFCIKYIKIKN